MRLATSALLEQGTDTTTSAGRFPCTSSPRWASWPRTWSARQKPLHRRPNLVLRATTGTINRVWAGA